MASEAIYLCLRYAKNFNPEISKNPFAYFTQIAWSGFIKIIKQEKKVSNLKKELYDRLYFDFCSDIQFPHKKEQREWVDVKFERSGENIEFIPCTVKHGEKEFVCNTLDEYLQVSLDIKEGK
jgi:hypothetical protein